VGMTNALLIFEMYLICYINKTKKTRHVFEAICHQVWPPCNLTVIDDIDLYLSHIKFCVV
jgi:hypothetical protein